MDENSEQKPKNGEEGEANNDQHQHVHIFGAEVGGGNGGPSSAQSPEDRQARREEWKKSRDEWKAHRQERREQWKAQREEWKQQHYHGGALFPGLIILLAGVVALLYTMGLVSTPFWQAIIPFWPLLIIMWGISIILGRHWFARIVIFLVTLALIIIVIVYGLVRSNSPVVSSLSPNVVRAIDNAQIQ